MVSDLAANSSAVGLLTQMLAPVKPNLRVDAVAEGVGDGIGAALSTGVGGGVGGGVGVAVSAGGWVMGTGTKCHKLSVLTTVMKLQLSAITELHDRLSLVSRQWIDSSYYDTQCTRAVLSYGRCLQGLEQGVVPLVPPPFHHPLPSFMS